MVARMNISDEQILAFYRNPSTKEKGFVMLMNAYQERLYNQIRRMLHNHNDTDDVLQNVLVKVWKNLDSFKENSKLYTWLYRIAMNETLTFLQKEKKHQSVSIEDYVSDNNHSTHNSTLTASQIEKKLEHAISTLPDKQKEVFNLRYYDEMTYEEMSDLLGTSVGALKASYHHAVKKVETILKAD
jgi:RNA polymerase sigma factor (sigma-70 family)